MKSPPFMGLSPVALGILAHLMEHPEAQDTVEGIAEWWLLDQRIRNVISEVKSSLAELEAQGIVLERRGRDGRVFFRLNSAVAGPLKELDSEFTTPSDDVEKKPKAGESAREQ